VSGDRNGRPAKAGPRAAGSEQKLAQEPAPPVRRRQRPAPADLAGLDGLVGYVVRRAQLWMVQDFRRVLKALGITPAQFSVLRVIAANPGISQVRVAEALAIERARLVQMIDSLEAGGHVERTRSATDRRSHALRLTETGAVLVERTHGPLEAHQRNIVARIGARETEELRRILAPFLIDLD
jgi:DNA-binding MarR family transcriptional regulator